VRISRGGNAGESIVNQQQAAALVMYLQRAHGIIPTTGAEWNLVQGALSTIEGAANKIIRIETKPAEPTGALAAAQAD
jgi:hypothetical protein